MSKAPFRIGICMEWALGSQILADFYDGIRLACDEALEQGALDRPVELVIREVPGPMLGTSPVVLEAWRELAYDEKVLGILGPVVTEANLAIRDEVNQGRVPTISFCATLDWAGPYCFALQNGAFVDEAPLLAAHIVAQGLRKVGVFQEDGAIGEEFFVAFRNAARRFGLSIVSHQVVGLYNTQEPVEPQLEIVRQSGAECVLVLSAYGALDPVRKALARVREADGWNPLKLQNMTWVALTALASTGDRPLEAAENEGWIGLDQIHEKNQTFQAVLDRFEKRYGRRPFHCYTALGYDHGQVVVDALARMKPPSPEGFKNALERTRMLPACIGGPETVISFGAHDHRGYKGEFIVSRTVRDGKEQLLDVSWADLLGAGPAMTAARHENDSPARDTARIRHSGERTPFRVGVLQDWALYAPVQDWYRGLELAFEEAYERGIVDRRIETVLREVEGSPNGDTARVLEAWRDLVHQEKVLAVVGPHITEMATIMRDEVERVRVPTISHTATFTFDGDFCFLAPNGTFADETYLIAKHLVDRGCSTVGVVREDNPIGVEYFDYFRQHARRLGLGVTADPMVAPSCDRDEMRMAVEAVRASGAQSIAHLGYGTAFDEMRAVMREQVTEEGWDPPRVTITTWVTVTGANHERGSPELFGRPLDPVSWDGWVGVDLPHEGNRVFQSFMERYSARYGGAPPFNCYPAHMYDMGRLLAEGIARARPVTPEGVQRGLEQVRMLPATMGAPGTVMSFGPHDHRAYKGAHYLVLRTLRNGVEGLVEEFDIPRVEATA